MHSFRIFSFFLMLSSKAMVMASQPLPWKDRCGEGWAWYHDFLEPQKPKEPKLEISKDPKVVLAIAKEDLERSLSKAILEPSDENIVAYISMQKKWVDQAKNFAYTWQRVILEHPELAELSPTTQYGAQVKKAFDYENRKKLINKLAKSSSLLFIYEGRHPFSQAFGTVVKQFSLDYDWDVQPISIDGIILREFPQSIADTEIAHEMELNTFPALFAVNHTTRKATPLAFGMETISQIEDNVILQFQEKDSW